MDSNHRSLTTTDLQSVPFGHSGTPPRYTKTLTRSCRNRKKERDLHRPPGSTIREIWSSSSASLQKYGAGDGNRTRNLLITNQLLCQLSYASSRYGNLSRKTFLGKKNFSCLRAFPANSKRLVPKRRRFVKPFLPFFQIFFTPAVFPSLFEHMHGTLFPLPIALSSPFPNVLSLPAAPQTLFFRSAPCRSSFPWHRLSSVPRPTTPVSRRPVRTKRRPFPALPSGPPSLFKNGKEVSDVRPDCPALLHCP